MDLSEEQRGFAGGYFLYGVDVSKLSRKSGLLVTFTPMSELRDCMVRVCPNRTDKLKRSLGRFRFAVAATRLRRIRVLGGNLRRDDR